MRARSDSLEDAACEQAGGAGFDLAGSDHRDQVQGTHRRLEFQSQFSPAPDRIDEPRHSFAAPTLEDRDGGFRLAPGRYGNPTRLALQGVDRLPDPGDVTGPCRGAGGGLDRRRVGRKAESIRPPREVESLRVVAARERDLGTDL